MRKIKKPKIGEYVLGTRWSDRDPCDPWYIGYIKEVIKTPDGILRYMIDGSSRQWRHVFRISKEEGEERLRFFKKYCDAGGDEVV